MTKTLKRRHFIKTVTLAGGGLALGINLPGCAIQPNIAGKNDSSSDRGQTSSPVSAWLTIDSDGLITIKVPSSEMGQGVHTSLPMIIADELDADWTQVRSETAPVNAAFVNPITGGRGTGGSSAVRRWWPSIAKAGAAAREMLVAAAAQLWDVPLSELTTSNSEVFHRVSNRKVSYGALAEAAGEFTPPIDPKIKASSEYTIIGKSKRRLDTPSKVNGTALFGIDIEVPGMLYATIAASPNFVGSLTSMDENAAKATKGVQYIVSLPAAAQVAANIQSIVAMPDAVAVVADNYWQAKKGLQALNPQFDDGGVKSISDASLHHDLIQALNEPGITVRRDGDMETGFANASQIVEVDFSVPFLAHLTMEPMNCTAHYKMENEVESLEIWAPTQGESHALNILQKGLGLTPPQITLHTTLMGGGFGRRYEADFILQAALISKSVGKPVKMLWSREEDLQHDYYRPASASRFKVGIDETGLPTVWQNKVVCPSVAQRNFSFAVSKGVDPFSIEGAVNIPYTIHDQLVTLKQHDTHIPVGSWRSVGSSHNGFYVESMMDVIAVAGGQDPFSLRRRLLQQQPRFLKVLDVLEKQSEWQEKPATNRFRGMAIHKSFASIVGEVAEISVSDSGVVTVHKMTCVVDCGRVVNPRIIEAQMEGSMIDGLTAALRGGIRIKNGKVEQTNFDTYKLMRLKEVPEMAVHIIENDEAPGGVGEPAVPPSMPALVNALYCASGKRVTSLPIEVA
ncbi:MAG: isoquinoline 1-oxidoreductase beta subunit [Oceanicoccus sp.]|jgi:isoquinoline 1-oxidoreductase beta subunit